ncbi:hypothetical protein QBC37DRAFT_423269 [Rhypophila decipiens]|uniref:Uncharacterized protein n=1 Tax=Rhypophila decipiens TaxID=261697 RepID=A0AAN6Y6B7_9PEZI|nr:hypothetical protein QBC37DRAFT_423269 [Rhypophila decipiens]
MSPDIALSVLASRRASTDSMNEKQPHRSPSSPDISTSDSDSQGTSPSSSSTTSPPSRPSTSSNSLSLSSLKSFFTTPGPASTGVVKKMPAFLMIATTALLFSSTSNTGSHHLSLLPQAHASAVPAAVPPSTSSYLTDPLVSASLAIIREGGNTIQNQNNVAKPENDQQNPILLLSRQISSAPGTAAINPQPGPIKWNTHCTHPGDEGIWNCMTTTWQRCVQGRWSVVMKSSSAGGVPAIHEPGYNKDEIICLPGGVGHDVVFVSKREAALLAAAAAAGSAAGSAGGGSTSSIGSGNGNGVNAAEGATTGSLGAGTGAGTVAGASGLVGGTETKWGGWNGGRYWSGADGVLKIDMRKRMAVVLAVAGAVGVLLGFPGVFEH